MPAEWEPHASTWLSWPHNPNTWPDRFAPIPGVWAELARVLSQYEPVNILAGGEAVMAQAQSLLGGVQRVSLIDIATNDCWMRDHGPTFLVGREGLPAALVDWEYNAWGGKYPPFDKDNAVPAQLAKKLGRRRFAPGIVMEGGAIDVNGRGTLLTTGECLLNANRNPTLSKAEVEQYLADHLGVVNVLWLDGHVSGDDTDGHVDELARFVNATTVVTAVEEDPADENYKSLQENYRHLQTLRDQDGRPLEVVKLPMPRPIYVGEQRVPACYANFYIANGAVIVPQFGDPADAQALAILGELLPGRRVIGLAARDLAWGLGAYHCITQQEPAL